MKKLKKLKPLIDKHGEIRELMEADFKRGVPFSALPKEMQETLKGIMAEGKRREAQRGRPKSTAPKEMIAFRFAPDVLAGIKGLGRGYNVRVEKFLRTALQEGKL